MHLTVKVVAGAAASGISGWLGDTLKLRVQAAPEKGKANAALIALLADVLGIPAADIAVERGAARPYKRIRIDGLDEAACRRRLLRAVGDDR